jgi:hypothetical protein
VFILASCSSIVKSKAQIGNFEVEIADFDSTGNKLCKVTGKTQDSALWIQRYSIQYEGAVVFVIIEKIASLDKSVKRWSFEDMQVIDTISTIYSPVTSMVITCDNTFVIIGK